MLGGRCEQRNHQIFQRDDAYVQVRLLGGRQCRRSGCRSTGRGELRRRLRERGHLGRGFPKTGRALFCGH